MIAAAGSFFPRRRDFVGRSRLSACPEVALAPLRPCPGGEPEPSFVRKLDDWREVAALADGNPVSSSR